MKSRSSGSFNFFQCSLCKVIVFKESISSHPSECLSIWENGESLESIHKELSHSFIKDGILFATVQDNITDWKNEHNSKAVALMHPSTMKLCFLGNNTFIRVNGGARTSLHTIFQCPAVNRMSVAYFHPSAVVSHRPDAAVRISSYFGSVKEAGKIIVSTILLKDFWTEDEFKLFVLRQLWDVFIFEGLTHKGKCKNGTTYEFTIKEISGVNPKFLKLDSNNQLPCDTSHTSFASEFSKLNISDKNIEHNQSAKEHVRTPDKSRSFLTPDFIRNASSVCSSFTNVGDEQEHEYFQVSMFTNVEIVNEEAAMLDNKLESILFKSVGGLEEQLRQLKQCLNCFLNSAEGFSHGVLMHGPSGSGKTFVATCIQQETNLNFFNVSASEFFYKEYLYGENWLLNIFNKALEEAPSIIFLDDLDQLCTIFQNLGNNRAGLLASLIEKNEGRVFLLATARDSSVVDPILLSPNKFDIVIEFTVPDSIQRTKILEKLLEGKCHNLNSEEITTSAEGAHGCTGFDLKIMCDEAEFSAFRKQCEIPQGKGTTELPVISSSDIRHHLKQLKPKILRDNKVQVQNIRWKDVGGMAYIKEKQKQIIEIPMKYPEIFKRFNIKPSRGVLLYGPPGCSKTMLAKALANESDVNFLAVKGSEVFSKWFGESEKAIRELFLKARESAPCVVFLDEIDALVADRGSCEDSNVGKRVVAQLLTEVDGIEDMNGVFIIAATNRPDMIDPAMLRPGRLDHLIYVPLPDADTRREILRINLKKMPVDDSISMEQLVSKTEGYSGAEVVQVCHEAGLSALSEDFPNIKPKPIIEMEHFERALTTIKPRIPQETIAFYEALAQNT